ncbi:sensor histidine kinase [Micromonospora endolithica]|uniref:histidine kinase n=1 Tax=Micromonospora endolithica TaxID=230091 RepID=A0A3A9ZNU5_9ACTN|nr:histidine kinase [Micromonospora endolithica]RKN49604.1 two-component sensor histidine kinase [Micromonospora endolithica]TWJ23829.1 signal transduction histidine kinase [Micromonospora endolithica]
MKPRRFLLPLVAGSTWRRGVFLLLGGVLVLPYLLLAVTFVQLLTDSEIPRTLVLALLVIAAAIALVPVFGDGSRALEIAAARALLGVDLPDPTPGHRVDRETRLRSALWIATHLLVGGLVMGALFSALPMAVAFIAQQFGLGDELVGRGEFGPLDGWGAGWMTVAGVALLVGLGYATAGLGALAVSMAPVLLGPAQSERIATLEARAARLAERNRLARELHDSVGHALTVATLQAGAARAVLDQDPEFVRRALAAIEDTGRSAMDDLDHVLGLLRESDSGTATGPQRTLADLDRLVADTRATGLRVDCRRTGDPDTVPAAVSREGYRIVQEGLTNAARYGRGPVALRLDVGPDTLELELVNDLVPARRAGPGRGGRGLDGMRERVLLLGGRLTAGPDAERWRVRVRLPLEGAR